MVQVSRFVDKKDIDPRLAAFTDDLDCNQFQQLLQFLIDTGCILPGNIKYWRFKARLPVNVDD